MRKTLTALAFVVLAIAGSGCRLFRNDDHPSHSYHLTAPPPPADIR